VYRLSDRDLEEALADRLSFRRFCGLGLEDAVPDATTISRFRVDLTEAGVTEQIFAALNRQLAAKGLFVKAGTMIDATLIEADVKRPPRMAIRLVSTMCTIAAQCALLPRHVHGRRSGVLTETYDTTKVVPWQRHV
jgi:IS5 family transposase